MNVLLQHSRCGSCLESYVEFVHCPVLKMCFSACCDFKMTHQNHRLVYYYIEYNIFSCIKNRIMVAFMLYRTKLLLAFCYFMSSAAIISV